MKKTLRKVFLQKNKSNQFLLHVKCLNLLKKQISPPIPAPRTVFTTNKVEQPIKRKFILDEPIPDEIQERHKKTLKPSPHKQIEEYISEILKKLKKSNFHLKKR